MPLYVYIYTYILHVYIVIEYIYIYICSGAAPPKDDLSIYLQAFVFRLPGLIAIILLSGGIRSFSLLHSNLPAFVFRVHMNEYIYVYIYIYIYIHSYYP